LGASAESGTTFESLKALERAELGEPDRDLILALRASCKGNLVRVLEELTALGTTLSYPALTAFCHRHGIGHKPPKPADRYNFAPGEEMKHDSFEYKFLAGRRFECFADPNAQARLV
jgi:hypothetical protein